MFKLFIVFVWLLSFINNVQSQIVINPYSECLLNLVSALGITLLPDSQNNYNFCDVYKCSDLDNSVIGFEFTQTSDTIITKGLMECYPDFKMVVMRGWRVEPDFLLFTSQIQGIFSLTMDSCSGFSLNYKVNVEVLLLNINSALTVKLSNILIPLSQGGVTILGIPFSGGVASIENDLSFTTEISDLKVFTKSIPDMSNILCRGKVHYLFNPSFFDTSSFFNIRSHSSIVNLEIESSLVFETAELFNSLVNLKKPLNYDYKLSYCYLTFPISSPINFGGSVLFENLYFKIIGSYSYVLFPFSKLPSGLKTLHYQNGNIGNLLDYSVLKDTDITSFSFGDNLISGELPKWSEEYGEVTRVYLQKNSLTGTIDSSYCNVVLSVKNNQLSGLLPECYACNLIDPSVKNNLDGNNFDNFQVKTCPIIPHLVMSEDKSQLLFYGSNIGYDLNFEIEPRINGLEMIKPNSLFSSNQYGPPNRVIHTFTSTLTGDVFFLTPDPYPPQLYNITSDKSKLIIMGQYFTYNSSLVTITIGGSFCQVDYASFYKITCTLSSYQNSKINVPGEIKVNLLVTKFNLNLDDGGGPIITYFKSCLNYCNFPNGDCDYNTGICSCEVSKRNDCSDQCSGSCNYGKCISGSCVCIDGYEGSNCNIKTLQSCLNNCTNESHGVCDTSSGICNCKSNWTGLDCSSPKNPNNGNGGGPKTNSTINPDGSTTVINENTSYNIYITSLLELDINGNQVNIYQLDKNWIVNQTLDNEYNSTVSFSQTLNNTICKIELLVQEIKKDSNYSFAGINFNLSAGSIKVSVTISDYQYNSSFNTLQLQMISNVTSNTNDCNSKSAKSTTTLIDDQLLNYITISRDNRVLYGRFINRALSDNKPTLISTSLISNQNDSITIGINIPHCNYCQIDPDFSVIITSDFKSNCGSSRKSYVIPVAVVVSVVGVAIGVSVGYIIYKKKKSLLFKRKLVKLNDLKT